VSGWVRLWHDMPTDPKWRTIAKRSGQPLACVIALFNLVIINASQNSECPGTLKNWQDDDAAAALDIEADQVAAIMAAFDGKVMENQSLTGWTKRQPRREDSGVAARVKAHRERKQNDVKRNVTQCNAPDADADADADAENEAKASKRVRASAVFVIPNWLSQEAWDGWVQMRKGKRCAPTVHAMKLAIDTLDGFRRNGHNPDQVLNQSTMNSWTALYEVKTNGGKRPGNAITI
jgi:hypothetical protein